jgi:polo-like kinase 1
VICYTLLIGKPPFETSNVKSTYKKIKANEYSFPSYIQISNEAADLVRSILQLEPGLLNIVTRYIC